MKASHSEVEAFLKCERNWWYGYVERIQPLTTSDAMGRGTLVHAGLAAYYECRKIGQAHSTGRRAAIDVIQGLASEVGLFDPTPISIEALKLVLGSIDFWENDGLEIIEVEKEVLVDITDDYQLPIVVDLVARWPGKGLVVIDHKTCYNFYNPDSVDLNPQLPKYFKAMQMEGYRVVGAYYNELRYRNTKDNEKDITQRFRRTGLNLTQARINRVMSEQIKVAERTHELKQLSKDESEKIVVRAANDMICDRCSFTDICISDLNQRSDRNLLLQYDYKPRVERAAR